MKLILISAIWCPSCLIMRPRYTEYVKKNNLTLNEYDFDDDFDIIKKYNIGDTLPVLIITDDNDVEIKRIIGEKSKKELEGLL